MEVVENKREKREFVNGINQTSEFNNIEIQELKQLIEKQNETVNAICSGFRQDNKQPINAPSNTEFTTCLQELTKAVQLLLRHGEKHFHSQSQQQPQKGVSFQHPQ